MKFLPVFYDYNWFFFNFIYLFFGKTCKVVKLRLILEGQCSFFPRFSMHSYIINTTTTDCAWYCAELLWVSRAQTGHWKQLQDPKVSVVEALSCWCHPRQLTQNLEGLVRELLHVKDWRGACFLVRVTEWNISARSQGLKNHVVFKGFMAYWALYFKSRPGLIVELDMN